MSRPEPSVAEARQREHSPTSVLSTRNKHFHKTAKLSRVSSKQNASFQNQVSPRLRETTLFSTNCCLVYTKPSLWEETPSRAQPSPAKPSLAEPIRAEQKSTTKKNTVSCRQNAFCFLTTASPSISPRRFLCARAVLKHTSVQNPCACRSESTA